MKQIYLVIFQNDVPNDDIGGYSYITEEIVAIFDNLEAAEEYVKRNDAKKNYEFEGFDVVYDLFIRTLPVSSKADETAQCMLDEQAEAWGLEPSGERK